MTINERVVNAIQELLDVYEHEDRTEEQECVFEEAKDVLQLVRNLKNPYCYR